MVRSTFPALSYDDYKSTFTGKIDVGIILTMNADQNYYDEHYKPRMEEYFWPFHFLNGKTEILASCDTLQVPDYSRYRMASWDETKKKAHHAEQFPKDLQAAFDLGKRLASQQ